MAQGEPSSPIPQAKVNWGFCQGCGNCLSDAGLEKRPQNLIWLMGSHF